MSRPTLPFPARLAAILAALAAPPVLAQQAEPAPPAAPAEAPAVARKPARTPDVIFVPTPERVVATMLDLARVGKGDVVYDLGCGDGRIVVAAAQRGARKAVGVDIDPERIAEARANVRAAGVADRVEIREGDLFELDLSDATVVTLYLLPDLNLKLRPKLLALRPGTRIVSHAFDMGDWKPAAVRQVDGKTVYFWTVPARTKAQARTGR
ncbi:cyclopropane-fatty-acyl-phospholipid synthase family protein [Anaeromyxobacter sp. SG66]|uniref:SAM-dependent methyltransferase n=1 Tax=Anaeromyxobacter sp. SG66 TaxID=2925410 RepID=UPI001F562C29|nr:class I SAM-dependent methyltransferase [Anaeromyxobacter sp. SG66]